MNSPRYWRLQKQRYRLLGEVCDECGEKLFPPRDVCPNCRDEIKGQREGSSQMKLHEFSGRGEVYSFSTVYQAPQGYEDYVPYIVALIKLEEGPLVMAQLTDVDPNEVRIGMQVEMVTRKLREHGEAGLIVYGYKFRPIGFS